MHFSLSLVPSRDRGAAAAHLGTLVAESIDGRPFQSALRGLHARFAAYAASCPLPLIAPGLIVTPEIRRQSELYLPIADITAIFFRLYGQALSYPPVLSSTPFCNAPSWADLFSRLPSPFQASPNPARLLETLLQDRKLLLEFLFASFMPQRFYGGFSRYPAQREVVRSWLRRQREKGGGLRCLDAACGSGEDVYGLAALLADSGVSPGGFMIDGWTLEPLEVWAAAHGSFPYDREREAMFRRETARIFDRGCQQSIRFRCRDLTEPECFSFQGEEYGCEAGRYDLILCNGLLGGPIISGSAEVGNIVSALADLLAPGGILLAADRFHGGWKSGCRSDDLKRLFLQAGLYCCDAGEGIGGARLPPP